MNAIRAVVVDDAALARERVRMYLQAEVDIDIVGEAASGNEAVRLICRLEPDLLFLDIALPDMDGFEIVRLLPTRLAPTVIYLTAHNNRAIEAFEVRALDYLLKPFDRDRFAKSVNRARHQIRLGAAPAEAARHSYSSRLAIKDRGRIEMVRVDSIDYIDVIGHYLCVHVGRHVHLIRGVLSEIERQLDPAVFARIHRSAIVRIDRIMSLHRRRNGDCDLVLIDGSKLVMSRTYQDAVSNRLGL